MEIISLGVLMVSIVDRVLKSEDFLAIAIILIATISALMLTYTEIGSSDIFYVIGTPLLLLVSLTIAYETFKALFRIIGREMEKGKTEVDLTGLRRMGKVLLVCPKCKTKNVEGAKFCIDCGERLE